MEYKCNNMNNLFSSTRFFLTVFFVGLLFYSDCQCTTSSNITTTYAQNNGQDGIMFDLFAINDITVSCFDVNWDPGTFNYEVYFKSGTAQGFQTNSGAWTLVGSGSGVTSAGNGNPTPIALNSSVGVCSGELVSFYITNTGAGHANLNYTNGTSLGNVFVSDANIQVREMYGKAYPFSSSYSPRVFNGTIYYDGGSCAILPIELIDFQAKMIDNRWVDLRWKTASEKDNDYFLIERSIDLDNWEFVFQVDGAGNSTQELSYSTKDLKPYLGLSYYRLTQVDFDGQSTSGKIRSVEINPENGGDLSIYPNPTSGKLKISGNKEQLKNLQLFDSAGQKVRINILASECHNVTIDMSDLTLGVYFFRSEDKTYKIVKM